METTGPDHEVDCRARDTEELDLQSRGVASPALLSQLNHILKFARDLSQHGESLPQAVLRIACENAFELIPQLAALWPRQK